MKYRDNMTKEELAEFMREVDALDALLKSAYEHDAKMQAENPTPEEWEDETDTLRKAALNRGQA